MQKLIFINSQEETLEIGYRKPYMLQNLIGLSDTPVDVLSSRGYRQDGQTAIGQYFQARSITFSVMVFGSSLEEMYENRRMLIKFLNPKDTFTVQYLNDHISVKFRCRVDAAPSFESAQARQTTQKSCTVSLVCDDPYLLDIDETVVPMSVETPEFVFPLIFYSDVVFSTLDNRQVFIDNKGDVPTPVRIVFPGPVTNPIIKNETTGEYVKVLKEIESDEILEITTDYGSKRVEIITSEGSRENAFHYIDLNSVFFQLAVGKNLISYDADSGAESATVYVYYSNRYVGV